MYKAVFDYNKLGKPITGFILITVNYMLPNGEKIKQEQVAQEIKKLEGVEEVNIMTGVTDILIKLRVSGIEELKIIYQIYSGSQKRAMKMRRYAVEAKEKENI